MSDDELDNLFREAAESHHVLHDPEAWQDMASRLDKGAVPAGAPGIARHMRWAVPVAVLIGVGTYLMWPTGTEEGTRKTQVTRQSVQDGTAAEQAISVNPNNRSAARSASSTPPTPGAAAHIAETTTRESFDAPARTSVSGRVDEPTADKHISNSGDAEALSERIREQAIGGREEGVGNEKRVLSAGTDSLAGDEEAVLVEISPPIGHEHGDTIVLANRADDETNPASEGFGQFFIKVAASPDLTSINYFHPGKVGVNYGLNVEYVISPRWSITTGAIWSRKIYSTTDMEGYTYGTYNVQLSALDGDCRIIDIPLNVYYRFSPGHALTLSVGAGFSSYVMMREDYTYWTQAVNGHGPYAYNKSIVHENNEWFKLLNLSMMVERQIGSRLSLQLEPFVKAPLAGVGDGKVSLVSAGAFLNFRYKVR